MEHEQSVHTIITADMTNTVHLMAFMVILLIQNTNLILKRYCRVIHVKGAGMPP